MLIGIHGLLESGKDTLGKGIQFLLQANKNQGVRSFVDFEKRPDEIRTVLSGFEIKKFAGKLKQMLSILTDIPVHCFESETFKRKMMPEPWGITYRQLMQRFATEGIRHIHNDAWVISLFKYWDDARDVGIVPDWIITDVRFTNEAEAIKTRGGIIIKITRGDAEAQNHLSETQLKDWQFDDYVENNSGIPELLYAAQELIDKYKIK